MRRAVWGVAVGSVLVFALLTTAQQPAGVFAQLAPPIDAGTSSELIALGSDVAEGRQQVTVIDPKTRVMSVYHIDGTTGKISLKSVRNIHADLLMDEYNTSDPLPREIRALLKQRQ